MSVSNPVGSIPAVTQRLGTQLPARWPGGSKRRDEWQIVPWIDWKALCPVSCSALLGGGLALRSLHQNSSTVLVDLFGRRYGRSVGIEHVDSDLPTAIRLPLPNG